MKVIFFMPVIYLSTFYFLLSTFYFLLMIIPQMPVRVARVGGYRNICQVRSVVLDWISPYKIAT